MIRYFEFAAEVPISVICMESEHIRQCLVVHAGKYKGKRAKNQCTGACAPVRENDQIKKRESSQMKMMSTIPMIKVTMVWLLYPCSTSISPKLVTTQK